MKMEPMVPSQYVLVFSKMQSSRVKFRHPPMCRMLSCAAHTNFTPRITVSAALKEICPFTTQVHASVPSAAEPLAPVPTSCTRDPLNTRSVFRVRVPMLTSVSLGVSIAAI